MGFIRSFVSFARTRFAVCILVNSWFKERENERNAHVLDVGLCSLEYKSWFSISVLGKDFQCNIFRVQCLRLRRSRTTLFTPFCKKIVKYLIICTFFLKTFIFVLIFMFSFWFEVEFHILIEIKPENIHHENWFFFHSF